jgi:hypothetical protein
MKMNNNSKMERIYDPMTWMIKLDQKNFLFLHIKKMGDDDGYEVTYMDASENFMKNEYSKSQVEYVRKLYNIDRRKEPALFALRMMLEYENYEWSDRVDNLRELWDQIVGYTSFSFEPILEQLMRLSVINEEDLEQVKLQ